MGLEVEIVDEDVDLEGLEVEVLRFPAVLPFDFQGGCEFVRLAHIGEFSLRRWRRETKVVGIVETVRGWEKLKMLILIRGSDGREGPNLLLRNGWTER